MTSDDPALAVREAAARRLAALDPLLAATGPPHPGCGERFVANGRDGQPAAVAACDHWQAEPGSLDSTWGASRRLRLSTWLTGRDARDELDELLSGWARHLAAVPGADDEDSAAILTWPSRDIEGVRVLQRHGLQPLAVIAARPRPAPGREPDGGPGHGAGPGPAGGVTVRRADPADIDEVVALGMALIDYDAHFGGVKERPHTASALRRYSAAQLAEPEPWTWLAVRDGAAVGMLHAERPEAAGWIAPLSARSPVAYLTELYVLAGERGNGIGGALAQHMHQAADEAGVAVTLLHYSQVNPVSLPFWSQQGYRPLYTSWETWPAASLR